MEGIAFNHNHDDLSIGGFGHNRSNHIALNQHFIGARGRGTADEDVLIGSDNDDEEDDEGTGSQRDASTSVSGRVGSRSGDGKGGGGGRKKSRSGVGVGVGTGNDAEGDGDGDDFGMEGGGGTGERGDDHRKRKRNRPILSCTECKRRKIKCDRQIPCEACVKRGLPGLCQWENPDKLKGGLQPYALAWAVNPRLDSLTSRLHHLETLFSRLPTSLVNSITSPDLDDTDPQVAQNRIKLRLLEEFDLENGRSTVGGGGGGDGRGREGRGWSERMHGGRMGMMSSNGPIPAVPGALPSSSESRPTFPPGSGPIPSSGFYPQPPQPPPTKNSSSSNLNLGTSRSSRHRHNNHNRSAPNGSHRLGLGDDEGTGSEDEKVDLEDLALYKVHYWAPSEQGKGISGSTNKSGGSGFGGLGIGGGDMDERDDESHIGTSSPPPPPGGKRNGDGTKSRKRGRGESSARAGDGRDHRPGSVPLGPGGRGIIDPLSDNKVVGGGVASNLLEGPSESHPLYPALSAAVVASYSRSSSSHSQHPPNSYLIPPLPFPFSIPGSGDRMLSTIFIEPDVIPGDMQDMNPLVDPVFQRDELLRSVMAVIPERNVADFLIDRWFNTMHWLFPVLQRRLFFQEYDCFWALREQSTETLWITRVDPLWISLFLMVLCLPLDGAKKGSPLPYPLSTYSEEQLARLPKVWFHASQQCLRLGDWTGTPRMRTIQTILLYAPHLQIGGHQHGHRFLIWLAAGLRICQLLGLHQLGSNPTVMPRPDPAIPPGVNSLAREMGKQLFITMLNLDWMQVSGGSGCYTINPNQIDIEPLMNLDSEDLSFEGISSPKPDHVFTDRSYERYKTRFVAAVREYFDEKQECPEMSYERMVEHDKRLRAVLETTGEWLAIPNIELDDAQPSRKWARNIGVIAVHNRLIRLHQPYLGRFYHNKRYEYSATTCMRSARAVLAAAANLAEGPTSYLWFLYSHVLCAVIVMFHAMFHLIDTSSPTEEIDDCVHLLQNAQRFFEQGENINSMATSALAKHSRSFLEGLGIATRERRVLRGKDGGKEKELPSFGHIVRQVAAGVKRDFMPKHYVQASSSGGTGSPAQLSNSGGGSSPGGVGLMRPSSHTHHGQPDRSDIADPTPGDPFSKRSGHLGPGHPFYRHGQSSVPGNNVSIESRGRIVDPTSGGNGGLLEPRQQSNREYTTQLLKSLGLMPLVDGVGGGGGNDVTRPGGGFNLAGAGGQDGGIVGGPNGSGPTSGSPTTSMAPSLGVSTPELLNLMAGRTPGGGMPAGSASMDASGSGGMQGIEGTGGGPPIPNGWESTLPGLNNFFGM